eukprot:scaffold182992_cov22-Tisochrysis_lutea.AAC.1
MPGGQFVQRVMFSVSVDANGVSTSATDSAGEDLSERIAIACGELLFGVSDVSVDKINRTTYRIRLTLTKTSALRAEDILGIVSTVQFIEDLSARITRTISALWDVVSFIDGVAAPSPPPPERPPRPA